MFKYAIFIPLVLILTGCGVNVVFRMGLDIDPSLERLTSDIREIAQEYKDQEIE